MIKWIAAIAPTFRWFYPPNFDKIPNLSLCSRLESLSIHTQPETEVSHPQDNNEDNDLEIAPIPELGTPMFSQLLDALPQHYVENEEPAAALVMQGVEAINTNLPEPTPLIHFLDATHTHMTLEE